MPKKLQKIIYIIDNLQVGGAQVHLVRLVPFMKEQFHVEIISLGPQSDKLIAQLHDDIKITSFNMSSIRKAHRFFTSFFRLATYLNRSKPHIVHTYLNTANVFGLLAARIAGVHNIVTSRRDMGHFRTDRLAAVESFLSRQIAKKVFCVCQAVAEATYQNENIPREKLCVLLNGIDTKRYSPRPKTENKNTVNFTMIAAMNREMKGHRDLIAAIGIFNKHNKSNITFSLVGDGPLRPMLEAEVKRLQIDQIVRFLGEQSNVLPILGKTDILILPSHSEGISNAILEAMAMEIPVVATAIDGNMEVVLEGETGVLAPPKDPAALADCILKYVINRDTIRRFGLNARKRVEDEFSLERMQNAYFKAYNEILQ